MWRAGPSFLLILLLLMTVEVQHDAQITMLQNKHTHTWNSKHTFQACLTPPPCCPQGQLLIPVCCTGLPKNTPCSLSLTFYPLCYKNPCISLTYSLLFFPLVPSVIFFPLLCSFSPVSYSFTLSLFFSFPLLLSLPHSRSLPAATLFPFLLPSPHQQAAALPSLFLCLREFNRSAKPKPLLGEWHFHVGRLWFRTKLHVPILVL